MGKKLTCPLKVTQETVGDPLGVQLTPLSPEQNVSYHYHKIYLGGLSFHEKQKSFALFYFPKAFPHLLQPLKSLAGCHLLKAPVMRQVGFLQTSLLQMRPVLWGQRLALGVEPLGCTLGS